jgi:hypothetical protein
LPGLVHLEALVSRTHYQLPSLYWQANPVSTTPVYLQEFCSVHNKMFTYLLFPQLPSACSIQLTFLSAPKKFTH